MSGIVGFYDFNNNVVGQEYVAKMIETLAHRGPDDRRTWCGDNVTLGHLMLWTTAESLEEKLPLTDATKNLTITADARIDNRAELIDLLDLELKGSKTIADSEIILAAYKEWGEECLDKLLGDFAFAIWDGEKQHLFCARDHFGVKPFYYFHQSDIGFVFASEIKALFVYPSIERQVNPSQIINYLELDFSDRVITSYEKIFRLPPAHYCVISQTELRVEQYWSLDLSKEIKLDSDREYAKAFREIFMEAVRCRLRSAFPIGSHLSGGLDSSSVTCVARKLLSGKNGLPLHTFSNIFDDVPECDERPYINEVLKQEGLIPHYVHADRTKPLSTLEQFWQYEDEAYAFPSYHYLWSLNKSAYQAGVRTVLDGFDGDSVVWHGFERLAELSLQGKWDEFIMEAKYTAKNYRGCASILARRYGLEQLFELVMRGRWLSVVIGIIQLHKNFGFSRKEIIIKYIYQPLLCKIKNNLFNISLETQDNESNLLSSNLINKYSAAEKLVNKGKNQPVPLSCSVKEHHYQNINDSDGVAAIAFEQADKCSSPHQMEMRHPFFDKRLVEFCLALPSTQKLSLGFGRVVMRRALEDILPPKIQWRGDKTSMTPNFLNSVASLDKVALDKVIFELNSPLEKQINTKILLEAYKQVTTNRNSIDENNIVVWRVAVLNMWLNYNKFSL